jgi:primosomal protein N' (replication factor Y)
VAPAVSSSSGTAATVQVALPLPIHTTFTYAVPASLAGPPAPGTRVLVPFRREERIGWVVGGGNGSAPAGLRPLLDVLDERPSVPEDILRLCRWMADYYVSPLGLALRTALPAVLSDVSRDYLSPAGGATGGATGSPDAPALTGRERRLLDALAAATSPRSVSGLRRALGMGSIWPEVRSLVARRIVHHLTLPPAAPPVRTRRVVRLARWLDDLAERDRRFGRARRQRDAYEWLEAAGGKAELAAALEQGFSRAVVTALEQKGIVAVADEEVLRDPFQEEGAATAPDLELTAEQRAALAAIRTTFDEPTPRPVLLHGITGSGKTLVYVEALRGVLERGRTAIVLVPEISLTPQTVTRFRAHFGDLVAVLHSGLSDGERYDQWRQLRAGAKRIAVGARSALFAPLPDLGVIVVDEEHDASYKQSDAPRYHARDLAVVRAGLTGAGCVLGTATPSLESWSNAERAKFALARLPERVGGGRLPRVRVVDLREVRRRASDEGRADPGILSSPLIDAVHARLERREQVILLLNRRGYASFVQCRDCGDVHRCAHCSVSLTLHRVTGRLLCHHCRYEEPIPVRCRRCGSRELSHRGLGTEQVERVVAETFPGARLARMDVDTTAGKWAHHEILGRMERGEVDVLLGTQMIAKGLDFPRVTLVGVVNADVGIHLPDFRASERTFQLLAQVAGRAGRSALEGEVIVQTSLPDHYAIQAALAHDFAGFAARELAERKAPAYPPWVRLANVVLSSPEEEAAAAAAERAVEWLAPRIARAPVEVVGPAPAPIERLHGRWRWHFLLRTASVPALSAACRELVEGFTPPGADVRMALDRDPVALL